MPPARRPSMLGETKAGPTKEIMEIDTTHRIRLGATALAVAAVFAGSALAAPRQANLVIRHQLRGCHAWSFDGGSYKASLKVALARGATLKVFDMDVMPHTLIQIAGPKASITGAAMGHMTGPATVVFARTGTYRFTTKAGEDYVPGVKTIGPDNVLRLMVVVR